MSEKKNLIVPKLQKQNLGKVNPQKAEYLYISKEFCKEGLSQKTEECSLKKSRNL